MSTSGPPDRQRADDAAAAQRRRDDELVAELTSPDLDESRESYTYWRTRRESLPVHRRAERREAQEMVDRWKGRVDEAERAKHGPGLLEQVLDLLGVRWRPNPRRLISGLIVALVVAAVLLVALVVAVVVFWSELEPILRFFLGGNGSGAGEGGGGEG